MEYLNLFKPVDVTQDWYFVCSKISRKRGIVFNYRQWALFSFNGVYIYCGAKIYLSLQKLN